MAIEIEPQSSERDINKLDGKIKEKRSKASKKKPFSVTVTAAKYDSWRSGEMYHKMGGLWGLCIGANKMRIIKAKVRIKRWVPWFITDKALNKLEEWHDFEKVRPATINGGSPYRSDYALKEIEIELNSFDKEERARQVKEICKDIKKEIEEVVHQVFDEIGEFEPEVI